MTTLALLMACGGAEEIALNPQSAAAGSTAVSGSGGGAPTTSTGGNSSNNPTAGGTGGVMNTGGMPISTPLGGSAGQPPTPPAQGGASPVGCTDDATCQSVAAPHCRADGRCVACLVDDDCPGEEPACDVVSGSCANVDCASGGNEAGGNCP